MRWSADEPNPDEYEPPLPWEDDIEEDPDVPYEDDDWPTDNNDDKLISSLLHELIDLARTHRKTRD